MPAKRKLNPALPVENPPCFEAGNLYLATYLIYRGFSIKGICGEGKFKKLLFEDSPDLRKTCAEFYSDSDARKLFDCYRRAKDYLFQNGV